MSREQHWNIIPQTILSFHLDVEFTIVTRPLAFGLS
jgi:hypothetical protein